MVSRVHKLIVVNLALTTFLFVAAPAARAECQLYEHQAFSGMSMAITDAVGRSDLGELNDKISSIKVSPQCLLVAFADPGFKGATTTFSPGEHPSLQAGWDDQISSARCNCR